MDSNIHSDEYTLKLFKSGSNVKRVVFYPSIFYQTIKYAEKKYSDEFQATCHLCKCLIFEKQKHC